METCELVRETGMELCSGGIIGLGESREQRLEFAFQLAALEPHEVPINFLNPRPGTPMGGSRAGLADPRRSARSRCSG